MAEFNPNGKWYKKYSDPKTSQKEKDKLYSKYGKKYKWPKSAATTTPAAPVDPVQQAISTLFGGEGGPAFSAGTTLAEHYLPNVSVNAGLTPEQQAAIAQATQATTSLGTAPTANTSEQMLESAAREGLNAQQLTALREAAMQQVANAMQQEQRRIQSANVAGGRQAGLGLNNLGAQYLQNVRDLNRDVFIKDIDYRQKALQDYADTQSRNFSNFWEAKNTANLGLGSTANTAAQQQRQAEEYNANQAYKRGADVFGSGISGAGWQNYVKQQGISNKYAADQIKAMWKLAGSGGGGGEGGGSSSNDSGTRIG